MLTKIKLVLVLTIVFFSFCVCATMQQTAEQMSGNNMIIHCNGENIKFTLPPGVPEIKPTKEMITIVPTTPRMAIIRIYFTREDAETDRDRIVFVARTDKPCPGIVLALTNIQGEISYYELKDNAWVDIPGDVFYLMIDVLEQKDLLEPGNPVSFHAGKVEI